MGHKMNIDYSKYCSYWYNGYNLLCGLKAGLTMYNILKDKRYYEGMTEINQQWSALPHDFRKIKNVH